MALFILSDHIAKKVIGTAVTETLNALGAEFYQHCSQHENWDRTEKIQEYISELQNLLNESNRLKAPSTKTNEKKTTDAQSEVNF